MLLYEGGEGLRFNEHAINVGLKGTVAVMREIGMLPKRLRRKKRRAPIIVNSTTWLRATKSGIMHSAVPLGAKIARKDIIAHIADPFGENQEKIVSPVDGIVIGALQLPLVHKGDALFHVAPLEGIADHEKLETINFEDELQMTRF